MDDALRLRLDLGLVLLAIVAASSAVAAYGVTDIGAVAAATVGLVALTAVVLFVGTTPGWAREDGSEAGNAD